MPDRMRAPANSQSDVWQQMEWALSIVHVTGLELIAEIKANGEQAESATRQKFDDALAAFHDALGKLGILPDHLRSVLCEPESEAWDLVREANRP